MPVAYPSTLPLLQRAAKSRTQPAAFSVAEPRRGYGYVQATGTDTPVFWDGQFKFNADDSIRFQLWFTEQLQRGLLDFAMSIRTEFGLVEHICRFLPDGLGDATEEAGNWTYPVKLMARKQIIPQSFADAQELIVALKNWREWSEVLDLFISRRQLPPAVNMVAATVDSAITFTRAGPKTYFDQGGILRTAAANVWPLEYDVMTRRALGRRVEPVSGNAALYSEQLELAPWARTRTTVVQNNRAAPNGALSAEKLVEDTSANSHSIGQPMTVVGGLQYTLSVFAASKERPAVRVTIPSAFFSDAVARTANLDVSTGASASVSSGLSILVRKGSGDGMFRCFVTFTATASATGNPLFTLLTAIGSAVAYTGDGASGLHLWGLQFGRVVEASYKQTTSVAVTQAAEAAQLTVPAGKSTLTYSFSDGTTTTLAVTAGSVHTVPDTFFPKYITRMVWG